MSTYTPIAESNNFIVSDKFTKYSEANEASAAYKTRNVATRRGRPKYKHSKKNKKIICRIKNMVYICAVLADKNTLKKLWEFLIANKMCLMLPFLSTIPKKRRKRLQPLGKQLCRSQRHTREN
jgi:hypothetical protein